MLVRQLCTIHLLLAPGSPGHLCEQPLERGVLVELLLLHQPIEVGGGGGQLHVAGHVVRLLPLQGLRVRVTSPETLVAGG